MQEPLDKDAFVWAIGSLCALHRVPFAADLLLRRFPPPYDVAGLQQALIAYEFKTAQQTLTVKDIHPSVFPVLAVLQPTVEKNEISEKAQTSEEPSTELAEQQPTELKETTELTETQTEAAEQENPSQQEKIAELADALQPPEQGRDQDQAEEVIPNYNLAIILKIDQDRVLLLNPGDQTPNTILLDEYNALATGQIILATRKIEDVTADGLVGESPVETKKKEKQPFGFKWFIPEILKHKKLWKEILLASLAIQIVALATPLGTQVIIDKVVVHHTTSTLIVIAIALGIFLVFNGIMSWVRQYLVLHTGNRIDAVLAHKVFGHMLHLPMRYFEHRPTGTLVARLQGVETIREFLAGTLITLLLDFPFLFVFLGIMFWYSWQLTLIALTALTLITILSLAITPLLRRRLNHQFLLGARNQAFLTEYISGMDTVKSLQLEPQLEKKYGGYLSTYLAGAFKTKQLSNTYNTAANSLDQLQTLSILCAGAWIVMHDPEFTIGMLVAFQMFSSRLSGPVLRLVGMYQEFQQADIAVKRLGDLMDAPTEPYSLIPTRANVQAQGQVTFEDVSFRYSDNHPWLYRNLSLTIKSHQCTVLMGPSGCGKSTLAKLLLGFVHPQEGNIKLDGKDIRYLSANELRNSFGVVPQETMLFSGTIYDNLTLANPHASFEQIIQACQLAGIHETLEELPEGYQTQIGEHGTGLSGGQKQRLAIARALLRQPNILIFDEAVSNLDQTTSEQFAQTINKLKGKVTILFITHQLPKGLAVDEVILLGKNAEETAKQQAKNAKSTKVDKSE